MNQSENSETFGKYLYGEILEKWPKTENGEPEEPVYLCTCSNVDLDDVLKANMLAAYSIPCLRVDAGDGSFARVVLGMSGQGTNLYVPKSLAEDAKALLEPVEEINSEDKQ